MASKNIKYILNSLLLFFSFNTYSQKNISSKIDTIFNEIFDYNLENKKASVLFNTDKPFVIISSMNCSGCTKYFTKNKESYFFIFFINSKSLIEINTIIKSNQLDKAFCYFVISKNINYLTKELIENPTPCLINNKDKSILFYNYDQLKKITSDFSKKNKKLIKELS